MKKNQLFFKKGWIRGAVKHINGARLLTSRLARTLAAPKIATGTAIAGIFATAVALLTLATPLRAAIPPVENVLPADTLFLLDTPDSAALRAASHQSPQWLFWNDPAMKPFH